MAKLFLFKKPQFAAAAVSLVVVLSLSGCHSQKKVVNTGNAGEATLVGDGSVGKLSHEEMAGIFSGLYEADNQWQRLRLPLSLRMMEPVSFSISGTATMVRDESIFISLRMLGFEVAQVFIDAQSVTVVDKYHKKYFSESMSDLLKGYKFNVSNLQSLLIGCPFVLGGGPGADLSGFNYESYDYGSAVRGQEFFWSASATWEGMEYGFVFNRSGRLTAFAAELSNSRTATVEYSQPYIKDGAGFSGNSYITVPLNNEKHPRATALFEWNFDKSRWDSEVDTKTLSVPVDYQKITVDELMKLAKFN